MSLADDAHKDLVAELGRLRTALGAHGVSAVERVLAALIRSYCADLLDAAPDRLPTMQIAAQQCERLRAVLNGSTEVPKLQ